MKEDLQKTMEAIKLEKTISKEEKVKIRKKIFLNFLLAIVIIAYLGYLTLTSLNLIKTIVPVNFNFYSIILLAIAIILFEISYKKENYYLAVNGIEILIIGLVTLFYLLILSKLNINSKNFYWVFAFVGVYYLFKAICINILLKRKYKQEQVESIKEEIELVKPEKRESLKKNNKENIKIEKEEEKIVAKNKTKTKKIKPEVKEEEKQEEKVAAKKRGRPKKIQPEIKEEIIEEVKQEKKTVAKKKGRPKKVQSETKEEEKIVAKNKTKGEKIKTEVKEEGKQEEKTVAKKRGRPKKVQPEIKEEIIEKVEEVEQKEKTAVKKRGRPRKVN